MPRNRFFLCLAACVLAAGAESAEITEVTPRLARPGTAAGGGGTLVTVTGRDLDATLSVSLTQDGGATKAALLLSGGRGRQR